MKKNLLISFFILLLSSLAFSSDDLNKEKVESIENLEDECPICFGEMVAGEAVQTTCCKQRLHGSCRDEMVVHAEILTQNCPFCRANVDLREFPVYDEELNSLNEMHWDMLGILSEHANLDVQAYLHLLRMEKVENSEEELGCFVARAFERFQYQLANNQ